ncbi:MAG: cation:proton antiporter [Defluviitaleaceae bacterium]|nr:cation:proton antiporter [Defluviitaleaceae bacterium]
MIFFKLAILIFVGLIFANVIEKIGLPKVSAYFLTGVLLGPSVTGFLTVDDLNSLQIVSQVALACICFGIGKSFNYNEIKGYGARIIVLTLFESLTTSVFVFAVLFFVLRQSFEVSILLAAIAAATAPAVPLMVLRQFKAKGALSKTIIPIVGLDDVVCVVVFGLSLAIVKASGGTEETLGYATLHMIINIFVTLITGVTLGYIFSLIIKELDKKSDILILTIGIATLGVGLALMFELELIILSITTGTIVANFVPKSDAIFDNLTSNFMPPLFLVFFGISAASLELAYLADVSLIGIVYILARGLGKVAGSAIGANVGKFPAVVKKYLGMAILSQAGVGIGLAVIVRQELGEVGQRVYTIALAGVLVYEIIGPLLTKYAVKRAGEI